MALRLLSAYGLVAYISVLIAKFASWRWLGGWEGYFLALLVLVAAVLFGEQDRERRDPISRMDWGIALGLFFGTLAFRIAASDSLSIWVDEIAQVTTARRLSPLAAASSQHQPPIDYLFSSFASMTAPPSSLAARAHALFFGACGTSALFLIAKRFSGSILVAALAAILSALHPNLVRFGVEARPISLGLFLLSLLLWEISSAVSKSRAGKERPASGVFAASLLAMLSVGLQPPLYIAVLALASIVLSLTGKPHWRPVAKALVASMLLFLPLQIYIINHSPPRFDRSFHDVLTLAMESLKGGAWSRWAEMKPYHFILLALSIALVAAPFRKIKMDKSWELAWVLGFTWLVWPVLLALVFNAFVTWTFQEHYLAWLTPLSWILLSALAGLSLDRSSKKRERLRMEAAWIVLLLVGIPFSRAVEPTIEKLRAGRPDLNAFWREITLAAREGEWILPVAINSANPRRGSPEGLLGGPLLAPKLREERNLVFWSGEDDPRYPLALVQRHDLRFPSRWFIAVMRDWSQWKPRDEELVKLGFTNIRHFNGITLAERSVPPGADFLSDLIQIYGDLVFISKDQSMGPVTAWPLIYALMKRGQKDMARQVFERTRSVGQWPFAYFRVRPLEKELGSSALKSPNRTIQ